MREWVLTVGKTDKRIAAKCLARLKALAEHGRNLRRSVADYLRDGIHELRPAFGSVNYRILYFFSAKTAVVVSHGFTKESKVRDREIDLAAARKKAFGENPREHTYEETNY